MSVKKASVLVTAMTNPEATVAVVVALVTSTVTEVIVEAVYK